jgi:hypothetical protein
MCSVQPLFDVSILVPSRRSNWSLGGGRVEIWLIPIFPPQKLAITKHLTGKRYYFNQAFPTSRGSRKCKVNSVRKLRVWPSVIGLEKRRPNVNCSRIINSTRVIISSIYSFCEARIVESIVLSVSSNPDIRFGTCYISDILQ